MTKAQERKRLVKQLDATVREWVLRDGARCVVCHGTTRLQCGHLFSRTHYSTRWDRRNVYAQCAGCNKLHNYDWFPMYEAACEVWGRDEISMMHFTFRKPKQFSNAELRTLLVAWRAKVEGV